MRTTVKGKMTEKILKEKDGGFKDRRQTGAIEKKRRELKSIHKKKRWGEENVSTELGHQEGFLYFKRKKGQTAM